jgi:hypothetical protein
LVRLAVVLPVNAKYPTVALGRKLQCLPDIVRQEYGQVIYPGIL